MKLAYLGTFQVVVVAIVYEVLIFGCTRRVYFLALLLQFFCLTGNTVENCEAVKYQV